MNEHASRLGTCLTMFAVLCGTGCNSSNQVSATSPVSAPVTEVKPTQVPTVGYWRVDTDTNAVTGELTKTAYLMYQGDQNIIIRKRGKKVDCYINTGDFLETVDNLHTRASTVRYKFDDGKVVRQAWTISDSNDALFYPGNPKTFLLQMQKAKVFSFEYKPADTVAKSLSFDVAGLPEGFIN